MSSEATYPLRAVLLALMLLLVAPEVLAEGAGWPYKRVAVLDYSSTVWGDITPQAVREMNAILPRHSPHLLYRRMAVADGAAIRPQRRTIVVCPALGEAPPATDAIRPHSSAVLVVRRSLGLHTAHLLRLPCALPDLLHALAHGCSRRHEGEGRGREAV